MPHGSAVYQQRCVPLPALRHCKVYGRHPAPLLPRPQFRACPAASTPERCCAPSDSPSRPVQRRTRQPCNPLSEEKAIRSLRSDRVTEKNQKKWKLLPEKKGRLKWIEPLATHGAGRKPLAHRDEPSRVARMVPAIVGGWCTDAMSRVDRSTLSSLGRTWTSLEDKPVCPTRRLGLHARYCGAPKTLFTSTRSSCMASATCRLL